MSGLRRWRSRFKELEQGEIEELQRQLAGLEAQIEEAHTITAPSCLSKGGLLDMARVLHALPSWMEIRVGLDLSEATGLTYIAAGAFTYCEALQSVKLPPSVIEIGPHAFDECVNLESVEIPEGITTIGDRAFVCCDKLESVEIPEGVTTIGHGAFSWCDNLASLTIPTSVTEIGYHFWSSNLESLTFEETDGWYMQKRYDEPPEPIDVSDPKANAENSELFCMSRLIRRTEP